MAEVLKHGVGHSALGAELLGQLIELLLIGKLALPQEVGNLLEGSILREVLDVVAAVEQLAFLAVDVGEFGIERDDAFEAAGFDGSGFCHEGDQRETVDGGDERVAAGTEKGAP